MGSMMTRYNQFLCVIGLTLMVGCTETTSELCGDGMNNGIWEGDITTEEELLAAKYCIEINGDILLDNVSNIREIDFPVLEQSSFILIGNSESLTAINFPMLEQSSTIAIGMVPNLTEIVFPMLERINGDLLIVDNQALTRIAMPRLTTVEDEIGIGYSHYLTTISFPVLVRSVDIIISTFTGLTEIVFPMLEQSSSIIIGDSESLTAINFPMLEQSSSIIIGMVPNLTEIKFPMLERINGDLLLGISDALMTLLMPKLDFIAGGFDGEQSDAMTDCDIGRFSELYCP